MKKLLPLLLLFMGCANVQQQHVNCVIDSVWQAPQTSVAQPYPMYNFRTDCGTILSLPNKEYNVGDTIKYISNEN